MHLEKFQTSPSLRQWIEYYWFAEDQVSTDQPAMIVPSCSHDLVFHLSPSSFFLGIQGTTKAPEAELVGTFNQSLHVRPRGRYSLVGVRFLPHALHALYGVDMNCLRNQIQDVRHVLGNAFQTLYSQIMDAPCHASRREILDRHFAQKIMTKVNDRYALLFNWLTTDSPNVFSVEEIVGKSGFSSRYVEKIFRRHIGVSPQEYLQIGRLKKALSLMDQTTDSLTSIAFQCGYSDQSHFIRTFKNYMEEPPKEFRHKKSAINVF